MHHSFPKWSRSAEIPCTHKRGSHSLSSSITVPYSDGNPAVNAIRIFTVCHPGIQNVSSRSPNRVKSENPNLSSAISRATGLTYSVGHVLISAAEPSYRMAPGHLSSLCPSWRRSGQLCTNRQRKFIVLNPEGITLGSQSFTLSTCLSQVSAISIFMPHFLAIHRPTNNSVTYE